MFRINFYIEFTILMYTSLKFLCRISKFLFQISKFPTVINDISRSERPLGTEAPCTFCVCLLVPYCIPVVWQGLVTAGFYTCTALLSNQIAVFSITTYL